MKKAQQRTTDRAKRRKRQPAKVQRRRSAGGVLYSARYGPVPEPKPYRANPDAQSGASEVNTGGLNSVGW